MRVLTFNTWGSYGPAARRPVLLQAIRALKAEILCLQEVVDRSLLKDLSYPTEIWAQTGGLAILSRLPLITHLEITFKTCSPLESFPRQTLFVQLKHESLSLWVGTTHLAWKAEDEATRLAQVEELLDHASRLPDPLLLSGDFNATPYSAPIRKIVGEGFLDLFVALHPDDSGITWDNRNPFIQSHSVIFPDRRIDYLFLRESGKSLLPPIDCEVVCRTPMDEELYPSDHYGVLARLKL